MYFSFYDRQVCSIGAVVFFSVSASSLGVVWLAPALVLDLIFSATSNLFLSASAFALAASTFLLETPIVTT